MPLRSLINETLARNGWPGESPLGHSVTVQVSGQPRKVEIVGVVGFVRHRGFDTEPRPELFLPHSQLPSGSITISFVVRTAAEAAPVMDPVKRAVWQVDPYLPFYETATMEQLVSRSLAPRRFTLVLIGGFAVVALLLAAAGIYAVISFATARRTHEIGVRMAMGAKSGDIFRLVLGEAALLAVGGLGLGLIAAVAFTRLLQSLLFGVTPTDPVTLGAALGLLLSVSLIAAYLPARRAMRVDPLSALRYE